MLAQRLDRLVEEGLIVKVPYEEHPPRFDYRFTDKGRAFWDVLAAMWRWGSDWMWEDEEPPVVLVDRDSRAEVRPLVVDEITGAPLDVRRLRMGRNPRSAHRLTPPAAGRRQEPIGGPSLASTP